jgi:hypothetical protein
VQNLFTACRLNVDNAALVDNAKGRAGRAAGYRLDIDRQPTGNQRVIHSATRRIA